MFSINGLTHQPGFNKREVMSRRIRTGSLYFLCPVEEDASDFRIVYWKDYIARVILPASGSSNRTLGYCSVETRLGEFIGPVLFASLQPLDRRTKNAVRREARRASRLRK
jgi:hypothetical protein